MRNYALLVLLFSSITTLSQNCDNSLSGIVTDIHDGQLLIGVTLIIANTEQAVQTGLMERFRFQTYVMTPITYRFHTPIVSQKDLRLEFLVIPRSHLNWSIILKNSTKLRLKGKPIVTNPKQFSKVRLTKKNWNVLVVALLGML